MAPVGVPEAMPAPPLPLVHPWLTRSAPTAPTAPHCTPPHPPFVHPWFTRSAPTAPPAPPPCTRGSPDLHPLDVAPVLRRQPEHQVLLALPERPVVADCRGTDRQAGRGVGGGGRGGVPDKEHSASELGGGVAWLGPRARAAGGSGGRRGVQAAQDGLAGAPPAPSHAISPPPSSPRGSSAAPRMRHCGLSPGPACRHHR